MRRPSEVSLGLSNVSDWELMLDFLATTIIEQFKDEQATTAMERCLKNLALKRAKEQFETREPKLPSGNFISSYLSAFRPRELAI
jgi:import receptor subunit TOM70